MEILMLQLLIQFLIQKYEILQSSATPNDYPAQARFRQKYSISTPFGMICVYIFV